MEAGSPAATDGFWAYSLRVYARPGVSAACLRLQDEADLDVNLLLFALYASRIGRAIGVEDWQRLDALVAPLREHLIQPLRSVRRWLKQQPPILLQPALGATSELRPALAELELQAERQVQALLEQALPSCVRPGAGTGAVTAPAANLDRYLQSRGVEPGADQRTDLATLVRAAEHEAQ
jgi:uncharacterized protein (TIGR02444 family)